MSGPKHQTELFRTATKAKVRTLQLLWKLQAVRLCQLQQSRRPLGLHCCLSRQRQHQHQRQHQRQHWHCCQRMRHRWWRTPTSLSPVAASGYEATLGWVCCGCSGTCAASASKDAPPCAPQSDARRRHHHHRCHCRWTQQPRTLFTAGCTTRCMSFHSPKQRQAHSQGVGDCALRSVRVFARTNNPSTSQHRKQVGGVIVSRQLHTLVVFVGDILCAPTCCAVWFVCQCCCCALATLPTAQRSERMWSACRTSTKGVALAVREPTTTMAACVVRQAARTTPAASQLLPSAVTASGCWPLHPRHVSTSAAVAARRRRRRSKRVSDVMGEGSESEWEEVSISQAVRACVQDSHGRYSTMQTRTPRKHHHSVGCHTHSLVGTFVRVVCPVVCPVVCRCAVPLHWHPPLAPADACSRQPLPEVHLEPQSQPTPPSPSTRINTR